MQLTHLGVAMSADQQTGHHVTQMPTIKWLNSLRMIGEEYSKEGRRRQAPSGEPTGFASVRSLVLGQAGSWQRHSHLARAAKGLRAEDY